MLNFSEALVELKKGALLTRAGWNGRGPYVALQWPDVTSKMSLPYLYIRTAQGALVPWLASQTDLLANDWQLTGGVATPISLVRPEAVRG